jgi:3-oxoacyl-[acyl-carrier-protein] synthase-3
MTRRSKILGCGSYLPERVVTNAELAKTVDTSDEWIVERSGIRQRHIASDGQFTSDLALKAAERALEHASIKAKNVDMVIVATTTPDNTFPATATKVQHNLGMTTGAAFDIQAVCSGFIFALSVADNMIKGGQADTIVVIGAETFSRILDWEDRGTCVLFGDGAGAVVLQASPDDVPNADKITAQGILSTHIHSNGSTRDLL